MSDFLSLKDAFSVALTADPERLHFAAHSHHLWPDCTRAAQMEAWEDAARLADAKWERVNGTIASTARAHIARILGLPSADQICLGANTNEFVVRLLSTFDLMKPLRVLTTDSEFHSFSRLINRYAEISTVHVDTVPVLPDASFRSRLLDAAASKPYDLIYVSQVFYNSGVSIDFVDELCGRADEKSTILIDGYHGFCAVPTDLARVSSRIFYTAGGYKYAASGEGICFLSVPADSTHRPLSTGWFAAAEALDATQERPVTYAASAQRFAGATWDPVGAYRFNAVMKLWEDRGLTVKRVHAHVQALKTLFREQLAAAGLRTLRAQDLILPHAGEHQAHFLVFKTGDAVALAKRLKADNIIVDARVDRLRIGFGIYHGPEDIKALFARLRGNY